MNDVKKEILLAIAAVEIEAIKNGDGNKIDEIAKYKKAVREVREVKTGESNAKETKDVLSNIGVDDE